MDLSKLKKLLFVTVLLFCSTAIWAENDAITNGLLKGRVLDLQRNPLPGASVRIGDSRMAVVTDSDGRVHLS